MIGSKKFVAELDENATAKEFSRMLPLELQMKYLNDKTPYSYSKIGRIKEIEGLRVAVGVSEISVSFQEK